MTRCLGRTLSLGMCLLTVVGCSDSYRSLVSPQGDPQFTLPSFASPRMRTRTGAFIPEETGRLIMKRIARQVALSLRDDGLRARVYQALHASPYPEHKLHVQTILESPDLGLLDAMAINAGVDKQQILNALDSVMDLEFYMPVKDHWAKWDGGPGLLVATAHHDDDIPDAFDLSGAPVPLSSARVPPSTPTLAVVPVETNFSKPPLSGSRAERSTNSSPTGFYMTFSYIQNGHSDYEGFLMGNPEFEVETVTHYTGDPNKAGAFQCAGENVYGVNGTYATPELLPEYVYDQNDDSWSGSVLLLSRNRADSLRKRNLGYTWMVWEDDLEPCAIMTSDDRWLYFFTSGGIFDVMIFGAGLYAGFTAQEGGFLIAAIASLGAGTALWNLGSEDDLVGILAASCATQNFPDANFGIFKDGGVLVGRAQVNNTDNSSPPSLCPPPPLTVSFSGPGTGQAFEWVTLTAQPQNFIGTVSYAWSVNGSPACGDQSTCTAQLGGEGSYTTFAVTITDGYPHTASNSSNVFAEYAGCPGCMAPARSNTVSAASSPRTSVTVPRNGQGSSSRRPGGSRH